MAAGRRDKSVAWAVASVNSLPAADESCSLLLNVFAPTDDGEYRRVLKKGGLLIKAMPLETHLFGLKKAVYDEPYLNGPADYAPDGFEAVCRSELRKLIRERGLGMAAGQLLPHLVRARAATLGMI